MHTPHRLNRIPRIHKPAPSRLSRMASALVRWYRRLSLSLHLAELNEHIHELRRHMDLDEAEAATLRRNWKQYPHLLANRMAMDADQMERYTRERDTLARQLEQLQ